MLTVPTLDVSSHNGYSIAGLIQQYPVEQVLIHAYHGFESPPLGAFTRNHIKETLAAGKHPGPYYWGFRAYSPLRTLLEGWQHFIDAGVQVAVHWLDCEIYDSGDFWDPGPDAEWLRAWFAQCDQRGILSGFYTAPWWVEQYFPGKWAAFEEFKDRPVWAAGYNQSTESVVALWASHGFRVVGHQYQGSPLDLSVFDPAYVGGAQEDPQVIAELQAQVAQLTAERAKLINTMGYLHGDVVKAFRDAASARYCKDVRAGVKAATNTLESVTAP